MQIAPDYSNRQPMNIEAYRGRTDPESIKAVSREMEALFVNEMLKVMRETIGSPEQGSLGSGTFMSMFDMELSRLFAERGLGVQESLAKNLAAIAEKTGSSEETPGAKPAGEQKQSALKNIGSPLPDIGSLRTTSNYGPRTDPFSGKERFHHGIDLAAPEGTFIHAVRQGSVVFSGEQQDYGNVVIIDHGDGFMTKYAHNQKNLVNTGDVVALGSVIAQVGSSGRSTGPHLHFELKYQGREMSPGEFLAMG